MNLSDLLEDGNKDLVIIYPGRFHPFHIGHGKVYKYLKQKYSNAKVFISTSGKVDGDRSPFTFEEKRKMMILAGVSSSDIVQTKSPYQSIEIMERFDKDNTVVVFAVSEKDMAEDPRFDFSNGLKLKKNGEPAYLQKWNSLDDAETFGTRGYIATTPTFKFKVRGQEINSASQIRNMIASSDDTMLTQMLQDLYSIEDVPADIIEIFKRKVGNKETMNENWDEHSFSEFLKENVIEDNIMKKGILTSITEGKSPHKKGTKKYNAHMAAMHAESIDEEFDRKVKEVLESKKLSEAKINEVPWNLVKTIGNTDVAVNKRTGGISATQKVGNATRTVNNHFNADGSQGQISTSITKGNQKASVGTNKPLTVTKVNASKKVKESAEEEVIAAGIKGYVDDHKENFDAYPQDVEVNDKVYDWDEYWAILDNAYPEAYDNQYASESIDESIDNDTLIQIIEANGISDLIVIDEHGKLINRDELHEVAPAVALALVRAAQLGVKYGKPVVQATAKRIGTWWKNLDRVKPQPYQKMSKADRIANYGKNNLKFSKELIKKQKDWQKNLRNGIKNEKAEQIKEWLKEDVEAEEKVSTLTKMQTVYKHNEDRNAHSENILMLAQAFGDRGEIKAIEGLLKTTKQQGYVTPEQSEIMYNSIHKKYFRELFPINEVWPAIAVAGAAGYGLYKYGKKAGQKAGEYLKKHHGDGIVSDLVKGAKTLITPTPKKKEFNALGNKITKVLKNREDAKEGVDLFKLPESSIMHYSDAKGTAKYSEGYKAAKDGVKYDENPYSGSEKLQWSKGHNDFRADKMSADGEPNYGARGQFESK